MHQDSEHQLSELRTEALRLFQSTFGEHPEILSFAPGRLNLIGEYTDFNGGFVMPVAIDKGICVAATQCDSPSQLFSTDLGLSQDFYIKDVEPNTIHDFSKYAAGMAWALKKYFGPASEAPSNLKAAIVSNLPIGSGVSSSAALEMAFGVIWTALHGWEIDSIQLAKLGQICENQFVGVNSGIMDQMASACGRKNQAMKIDTRSLEIEYASVPDEYAVLILDTKKSRELAGSAYNVRRAQCEEAASIMGVSLLRDVSLEMLAAHKSRMDAVVYRRAKHVITEDARTKAFTQALAHHDENGVFALMRGSHVSLQQDFEVSCFELDSMVESAWLSPGIVGARMTGAGFGGCAVALVKAHLVEEFATCCLERYQELTGKQGAIMVCQVADGARVLAPSN